MRNGIKYYSILIGSFAAMELLLNAAVNRGFDLPSRHPLYRNQWLVDQRILSHREWRDFSRRLDVLLALTFVPLVSGVSHVLESDFNVNSNTIFGIGSGFAGLGGSAGSSTPLGGAGGNGGSGGAFASITNYNAHSAGQSVNIQVGASDSWFDSTSVLLAKAASPTLGGQASACVGSVKFSGGNGGVGGAGTDPINGGGGGGGGGAGGPSGAGNNGAAGSIPAHGAGASGDAGVTPANSNGTEFQVSPAYGSGGGGDGGDGGNMSGGFGGTPNGADGKSGGSYGAGGGGGGGGRGGAGTNGGNGGNAFQGLLGIQYSPASGPARSFGFIVG